MKTIFVTGTDTGVGKTLVSKALVTYCVEQGFVTTGFKPVAAGAQWINDELRNEDAMELLAVSNSSASYALINPCVLETATAPHIAANLQHQVIDPRDLDRAYEEISRISQCVVVEGAGGWQVPLNGNVSFADWVAGQQWPVLLVVNIKLGCINHARLTILDIQRCGISLVGWVANIQSTEIEYAAQMIEAIDAFANAPLIGTIPPLGSVNISGVNSYLDFSRLINFP